MIRSFEDYRNSLKESRINSPDVVAFRKVLAEHPELSVLPIHMGPDGKKISKIYRTVRQPSLFDDIYGTHGMHNPNITKNKVPYCLNIVYADKGPMTPIPKTKPMILMNEEHESDEPGWTSTTDWTIDPEYYYTVHDEVIRICLDFEKVKKIVGNENILNLLHDNEAEIRLRTPIPLFETLDHIEIIEEFFYEDVEGEYGVDRAIETWFPKELMPYLILVDDFPMGHAYSTMLDKYYDEVYSKYGVKPIKPYGNTWIDQK